MSNRNGLMLPMLLAGPILRRADPSQVCIWIACSMPFHMTAEIFQFRSLLQKRAYHQEQKAEIRQADNNAKTGALAIGCGTSILCQKVGLPADYYRFKNVGNS